jgi:HEAT repeat protein
MIERLIIAALVMEFCYGALLLFLLARALAKGAAFRRRTLVSQTARPVIRDALINYLAGSNNLVELKKLAKAHRRDLVDGILEVHAAVSGGPREQLWDLSLQLALVQDWCTDTRSKDRTLRCLAFERLALACWYEPCRRIAGDLQLRGIDDPDVEVRFAAARGLAYSAVPEEVQRVFELAVSQNSLGRVLLTEVLRPHAMVLCEGVVAEALRSSDESRVISALEIALAWERAVPLMDLHRLVAGGSPAVRQLTLRLLPLVPSSPENDAVVIHALADKLRSTALEAVVAAGRLRVEGAIPGLTHFLKWGDQEMSRLAADALAEIPPRGWEILQEFGSLPGTPAVQPAREEGKTASQDAKTASQKATRV